MLEHETRPVFDPQFWRNRIDKVKEGRLQGEFHRSIFNCNLDEWLETQERHRKILAQYIQPTDSILDVGCGYGRLLDLLPVTPVWFGGYLGIDISPEFIDMARARYACRGFLCMDARNLSTLRGYAADNGKFDWAVLISFRLMVINNQGQEVWDSIEAQIRSCCSKILCLEYPSDEKELIL